MVNPSRGVVCSAAEVLPAMAVNFSDLRQRTGRFIGQICSRIIPHRQNLGGGSPIRRAPRRSLLQLLSCGVRTRLDHTPQTRIASSRIAIVVAVVMVLKLILLRGQDRAMGRLWITCRSLVRLFLKKYELGYRRYIFRLRPS